MAVIRDIAKHLGVIPRLLAKRDEEQSKEIDRLMGENEMYKSDQARRIEMGMKKGGKVKKMAAGGSASKRADGCAQRGKTRGKMV